MAIEHLLWERTLMSAADCWYYAYGSNMNPERVTQRGLDYTEIRAGWVAGLGLRFNKHAQSPKQNQNQSVEHPGCGHANLVHAPNETAEGVLYRLTSHAMIERMDPFERAPINYSRECTVVQTLQGEVVAWTYFANPAVLRAGLRPTRGYLNHLLAGKRWLSPAYFERLVAQPVADQSL